MPIGFVDVLPTLAELCDLAAPATLAGSSRVGAWLGEPEESRALYFESLYPLRHYGWSELQGVVRDHWKYVEAPQADESVRVALYDLETDPSELHDRAASEPEITARLMRRTRSLLL